MDTGENLFRLVLVPKLVLGHQQMAIFRQVPVLRHHD